MSGVSIRTDGEHITLVAADQLGSAIQTGAWKTGAIMARCDGITVDGSDPTPIFSCPDAAQAWFLAAVAKAMTASGPVNVGLTAEKGDGLRAVFYFPNAKVARRRMNAAISSAGGPPNA